MNEFDVYLTNYDIKQWIGINVNRSKGSYKFCCGTIGIKDIEYDAVHTDESLSDHIKYVIKVGFKLQYDRLCIIDDITKNTEKSFMDELKRI